MKIVWFLLLGGMTLSLCAEVRAPIAYGEDNPRKTISFTNAELDIAYKQLVEIIGDDLKDVALNRKTKQEVARTAEAKSRNPQYPPPVRFLLAKGAFGLYSDAGEVGRAKSLLISMDLNEHYALPMLLDMMHESRMDFGIKCAAPNCPLILASLTSFGNIMEARYNECIESVNIKELKLGDAMLSSGAKNDNWHFGHNPIRMWEQGRISVKRKDVKLEDPIGTINAVELYFTKESGRLYKIIFNASYGSTTKREDVVGDLKMVRALIERWGIATNFEGTSPDVNIDDQVEAHHAEALEKFKRNGYRDGGMMLTIGSLSDCGLGDVRIDGDVSEDMHHCKGLRVCICDEQLEALGWKECGIDPAAAEPLGSKTAYTNSIAWIVHMHRFDKKAKYIGRLGWGFEHGLYGMPSNRQDAVSFYRYAGLLGNRAALSQLSSLNMPKELTDEDMARVRAIFPGARSEAKCCCDGKTIRQQDADIMMPDSKTVVPCMVVAQARNDDAVYSEIIIRGRKLGREMLALARGGAISTNGWGMLESLVRSRQIAEEMYGIMTNTIVQTKLQKKKAEDGVSKSKQGIVDADIALNRSRLKLCTTINGKTIQGAIINVDDCQFSSPVTIAGLKMGSEFGPYTITCESHGKQYLTKFQKIKVTWEGLKVFSCPLREVK